MASNLLVGIIDPDRERRDTFSAILDIEFALSIVAVATLQELTTELRERTPNLIIVSGSRSSQLGEVSERHPYVPLVVIGESTSRGNAALPLPVDAAKLVKLISELLAE